MHIDPNLGLRLTEAKHREAQARIRQAPATRADELASQEGSSAPLAFCSDIELRLNQRDRQQLPRPA